MNKIFLLLLFVCAPLDAQTIDLSGPGWSFRTPVDDLPQIVSVPDSWPTRKGFEKYLGTAIYEKEIEFAGANEGKIVRLRFGAVYEQCSVWLNGQRLGNHVGGYSPFEFDVTRVIRRGQNHLLVETSNVPSLSTIPTVYSSWGSKDYPAYGTAGRRSNIVGWMPYGGIVRPVTLQISDAVHVIRSQIISTPDIEHHTAAASLSVWVQNSDRQVHRANVTVMVDGQVRILRSQKGMRPNSVEELTWKGTLQAVHLWSVRDPHLYEATLRSGSDKTVLRFGVREIRVRGTELLLNGTPVHLFGANRVSDHPKYGLEDSDEIIRQDMSDMLAANMRMMRIAHYPQVQSLLEFADEHGILLIAEAGNWNLGAWQMADPELRERWKADMKQMMQDDWNHPSVIAWSVGNEYESQTQDGIAWTRDMRAFTKSVDSTRLVTFASKMMEDPRVQTGSDEGSQYSDFVSVNCYGDYGRMLDRTHELYPGKPVFMTEFGKTGEAGLHDPERIENIRVAVSAMKARPWVIGGALWAWNDYRSLHRGTPPSGIRYWGVVTADREHRESWSVTRDLFAAPLP